MKRSESSIIHPLIASKDERPSFFHHYLHNHVNAIIKSASNLWHNRLGTFITIIMIAVALALPISLLVFLENAKSISTSWNDGTQISVYLKTDVSPVQLSGLLAHLREQPDIADVNYISPEEGLAEFQQQTGLNDALMLLKNNPLPGVILIEPKSSINNSNAINNLLDNVKSLPEVDNAMFNLQWIKRLTAIIELSKHIILALGCLLACGILFIIGNAIQSSVQKYHEEITVLQLIGADTNYIRRPFLYAGFYYGFLGAFIALCLVSALLLWLSGPVTHLTALYNSNFQLESFHWKTALIILLVGSLLGISGAALAVNHRIKI